MTTVFDLSREELQTLIPLVYKRPVNFVHATNDRLRLYVFDWLSDHRLDTIHHFRRSDKGDWILDEDCRSCRVRMEIASKKNKLCEIPTFRQLTANKRLNSVHGNSARRLPSGRHRCSCGAAGRLPSKVSKRCSLPPNPPPLAPIAAAEEEEQWETGAKRAAIHRSHRRPTRGSSVEATTHRCVRIPATATTSTMTTDDLAEMHPLITKTNSSSTRTPTKSTGSRQSGRLSTMGTALRCCLSASADSDEEQQRRDVTAASPKKSTATISEQPVFQ